jgi:hypothetical protein
MSKEITSFSMYEIVSPKFTEGQIKTDETKRIHNYGIPEQSRKLTIDESGIIKFSEKGATDWAKEQTRHKGEWMVSCKDSICSVCGKDEAEFICGTEDWYGYGLSNYCPNCGARMKGADDEISCR